MLYLSLYSAWSSHCLDQQPVVDVPSVSMLKSSLIRIINSTLSLYIDEINPAMILTPRRVPRGSRL